MRAKPDRSERLDKHFPTSGQSLIMLLIYVLKGRHLPICRESRFLFGFLLRIRIKSFSFTYKNEVNSNSIE
jgi:hypothetical protein